MELFLPTLDFVDFEHIESHSLAQWPTLACHNQIAQLNISVGIGQRNVIVGA